MPRSPLGRSLSLAAFVLGCSIGVGAEPSGAELRPFLEEHCLGCHDAAAKKGGLDLDRLSTDLDQPAAFDAWVKVHDRLEAGEMPPPKEPRPDKAQAEQALKALSTRLVAADLARRREQGRALFRRLNRVEYENTLRDLFSLPGLSVRDLLPEDGRAFGFDKSAAALDLSHIQLAKFMEAADAALDHAIATQRDRPEVFHERIYPGAQYDFKIVLLNGDAVFLKDGKYDDGPGIPIIRDKAPQGLAELERAKVFPYTGAVGVFRHEDDAFLPRFSTFAPIFAGRYRIKVSLWSFEWDRGEVKPARATGAASLIQNGRVLGYFDAPSLTPKVHEFETWLTPREYVRFNAASLWPLRVSERKGRAAEYAGPGIAIDWIEVEGPLHDDWPPAGHRLLFGDLPMEPLPKPNAKGPGAVKPPHRERPRQSREGRNQAGKFEFATVAPRDSSADADRLLAAFLPRAFRRPVASEEVARYAGLVRSRLDAQVSFEEAMRTAYKAALCAPDFLYFREAPGTLDDRALAVRLSYFLANSTPDDTLTALAEGGTLHEPEVLKAQVERLLADPKVERFVTDFLDQWLELRDIDLTSPDRRLYPEFGPYLKDSMLAETRATFRALLDRDLGVGHLVRSDFALLNQKMAEHYGVSGVEGTAFRAVDLPVGSHRGGFLSQASVLKVTANGTVTSPVKRGAWVQRHILGQPPDPPPPNVPAIEPDVRGATTVRELLDRHRNNMACAACHAKIDPPGFALENYDVIGGWQERYRSLGKGDPPDRAKTGGHGVGYRLGLPVDPAGTTARGQAFGDIEEFKALLLQDERPLARNLVAQLLTYATGAPVGFADRAEVEAILDRAAGSRYGIRSLIHGVAQSGVFRTK